LVNWILASRSETPVYLVVLNGVELSVITSLYEDGSILISPQGGARWGVKNFY